jgi:hypothetical protein
MKWRLAAVLAFALTTSTCGINRLHAPTYTSAGVTIRGCPAARVPLNRPFMLSFSVVNRGRINWPATYVLLSPSGAMKARLAVDGEPTQGIGGGITRVKSPLAPGHRITGSIRAYLIKADTAMVNLGAWGAPANSVSVPTTYTNPSCTAHP